MVRWPLAAATTSGVGSSVSGPVKTSSKSKALAAWANELKTLLPSPVQTTLAPLIGPFFSS